MADSAQITPRAAGLGERLVSGLTAAAAAFEQVAVAPSPQAAAMAPEVVRRLIAEVVPRLQQLEVLVPAFAQFLVSPEQIGGLGGARAELGMLAEQLSGIVYNLAPADARGRSLCQTDG